MTRQRKVIKDIIYASYKHPTADEIYAEAKKKMPNIAVGTVYRNLSLLVESGEVRKIDIPNAPSRYDRPQIPHEHLICSECGAVADVKIDGIIDILKEKTGEEITEYKLTMYYICPKCKNK
ncbi:MAG: transcriptional repressor [Clostridiales bacterium]|nr:transcriptional repressor [Clostridiales bacterium]